MSRKSTLRAELEAIRKKHRGRLTPAIVLKEASDPAHPLHNRFEWNDDVAAHKYRLEQAHELIVSVRVEYTAPDGEKKSARWYHAVRAADAKQFDYEPADEILADPLRRKLLLREMERQVNELVSRYEGIQEFWTYLKKQKPKAA